MQSVMLGVASFLATVFLLAVALNEARRCRWWRAIAAVILLSLAGFRALKGEESLDGTHEACVVAKLKEWEAEHGSLAAVEGAVYGGGSTLAGCLWKSKGSGLLGCLAIAVPAGLLEAHSHYAQQMQTGKIPARLLCATAPRMSKKMRRTEAGIELEREYTRLVSGSFFSGETAAERRRREAIGP